MTVAEWMTTPVMDGKRLVGILTRSDVLNAFLVFAFLRTLTRQNLLAGATALLFALHPMRRCRG